MSGIVRIGFIRILGRQPGLLTTQNSVPLVTQKCNISGKTMRGGEKLNTVKPFPYTTKKYNWLAACFDKTTKRINENSKLILVEGPIAAGKTEFAMELAEELEMLHMPEANMDMRYINPYGYDMRKLDPQLPETVRSFDHKDFCRNPKHFLAARFQIEMYMLRYSLYIDAIAHILNTGQGVVMERSPYSDMAFAEAMYKHGYMSEGARSVYYDLRQNTIHEILKPHLVIYLDVPPKIVQEQIKSRDYDYEVDSKLFTEGYLKDMEAAYKQNFLKNISVHAELLVYDWSDGGDTEVVVEDIERIDFDQFEDDKFNKKMKDWRFNLEWDWCEARVKYSIEKCDLMNNFNVPRFDVPELLRDAMSAKKWRDVWFNAPGMKYKKGYNADMGDKGILTKTTLELRNTI